MQQIYGSMQEWHYMVQHANKTGMKQTKCYLAYSDKKKNSAIDMYVS